MDIATYLKEKFPDGIEYETAVQLCLGIYSIKGLLPFELDDTSGSMSGVSNAFSKISQNGIVKDATRDKTLKYGAESHPIESSCHWNDVIDSIFKKGVQPDLDVIRKLLGCEPATRKSQQNRNGSSG